MEETHQWIKIERGRYVHFTCPTQPKMELVSFDFPVICPVCRRPNPVRPGNNNTACRGYSRERDLTVIRKDGGS